MLKKHMAACLFATAFVAAPVLAQTTPPPPSAGTDRPAATGTGTTTSGSNAMQPGAMTPAPATPSPMAQSSGGASQGQFMTQMQPNQMMASSLIGTTVVSANNESIGDVNDVIMDRNGQTMAVVIGVGGFLGIGEKDVAVQFSALDFNAQPQATASNAAGNTSAPATTGSTAASQQNTASNTSTATTGNTGNSGASASANASSNDGGVPDRVVLKMTKAELQAAPAFQTSNRTNANDANRSGATTGAGGATTAPKP